MKIDTATLSPTATGRLTRTGPDGRSSHQAKIRTGPPQRIGGASGSGHSARPGLLGGAKPASAIPAWSRSWLSTPSTPTHTDVSSRHEADLKGAGTLKVPVTAGETAARKGVTRPVARSHRLHRYSRGRHRPRVGHNRNDGENDAPSTLDATNPRSQPPANGRPDPLRTARGRRSLCGSSLGAACNEKVLRLCDAHLRGQPLGSLRKRVARVGPSHCSGLFRSISTMDPVMRRSIGPKLELHSSQV